MTMGVVVVVLVGDRAGADVDVGLDVGLEDVELSGWPCSLEVCLVELAGESRCRARCGARCTR